MQKITEKARLHSVESEEKVFSFNYIETRIDNFLLCFVVINSFIQEQEVVKLKKQLNEFIQERQG